MTSQCPRENIVLNFAVKQLNTIKGKCFECNVPRKSASLFAIESLSETNILCIYM